MNLQVKARIKSRPSRPNEGVQQAEMLQCVQCRERWQVVWVEAVGRRIDKHRLTCDCGRLLKVVYAVGDDPPLMILQHPHWETILAWLPAFITGALFPLISDRVLLTAYLLSWVCCAATFVNKHNGSASALFGIAIWSNALISGAAAAGALLAYALWWWGQ